MRIQKAVHLLEKGLEEHVEDEDPVHDPIEDKEEMREALDLNERDLVGREQADEDERHDHQPVPSLDKPVIQADNAASAPALGPSVLQQFVGMWAGLRIRAFCLRFFTPQGSLSLVHP